jgi:hypothetical protein
MCALYTRREPTAFVPVRTKKKVKIIFYPTLSVFRNITVGWKVPRIRPFFLLVRATEVFSGEKIFSMPSFGGEVKPSVPCRRFAACKRSLNGVEKASCRQNYRTPFSPTVPPFATRSARVVGDVEASGGESGNI